MKKIKPYIIYNTPYYEELVNVSARNFTPQIFPLCANCHYPVIHGFCCITCGNPNPLHNEEPLICQ